MDIQNDSAKYYTIFDKFKRAYPNYSYPKVCFTIGAMQIGGFNKDDESVVMGTELVVGNKSSKSGSLKSYLKTFLAENQGARYLVTHEIVHTQQKHGNSQNMNLTGLCLMEGSADFITGNLLKQLNTMPYSIYGRSHYSRIKHAFIKDKLKNYPSGIDDWIYNASLYDAGMIKVKPDLGYFIGYKICECYFKRSRNKQQAIANILAINYDDKNSVMSFYNKSGFED